MTKIHRFTENARRKIKKDYGIELKWQEVLNLSNYFYSTKRKRIGYLTPFFGETCYRFIEDFFGLDENGLGEIWGLTRSKNKERLYDKVPGMKFLGTEPFKQYCRNQVGQWRQERELF